MQDPHKGVVQHNVCEKARHHDHHGVEGAAHVADEGHKPCAEDLEHRPKDDDAQVGVPQVQDMPGGPQRRQDRRGDQVKDQGGDEGGDQEKEYSAVCVSLRLLPFPGCQPDGIVYGAAHPDAGAGSLQEGHYRVGDVDGGQSHIADAVPHKEAVYDTVDTRQGEGQE